ncbi:protein of unknown function [Paraburkholderia kururiensis]
MGAHSARAGREWRQYLRDGAGAQHASAHAAAQAREASGEAVSVGGSKAIAETKTPGASGAGRLRFA